MNRDRTGRPRRGGNSRGPVGDLLIMGSLDCTACREELSAELDGEGDPARRPPCAPTSRACASCTEWREQAAVVTRLTRTAPAQAGPDLVAVVLPAAPRPGPTAARRAGGAHGGRRRARSCSGCWRSSASTDTAAGTAMLGGADMAHMSHETAAWNLALGAAFVAGACWTRHLAGLLPVLGVFIVVLARAQRARPRGRPGGARPGRDARAAARRVRPRRARHARRPRARTAAPPPTPRIPGGAPERSRAGSVPAPARRADPAPSPARRPRPGGPRRDPRPPRGPVRRDVA